MGYQFFPTDQTSTAFLASFTVYSSNFFMRLLVGTVLGIVEGVTPAFMLLMQVMYDMFKDFIDWTIVIFDNILILANDQDECAKKVEKILQRCFERNSVATILWC
jgi:hypothetical protein